MAETKRVTPWGYRAFRPIYSWFSAAHFVSVFYVGEFLNQRNFIVTLSITNPSDRYIYSIFNNGIPFNNRPPWDFPRQQARIAGALGGRAAEQLVFGTNQVTTGDHGWPAVP